MTTLDYMIYGFLLGGVVGLLIGLIPLFFGFYKKQKNIGIISLIVCGISGGILGYLLAIPVCILCCVIIYMVSKSKKMCIHCAEIINKDANICKHCGLNL